MLTSCEVAELFCQVDRRLQGDLHQRPLFVGTLPTYYGKPGLVMIGFEGSPTRCPVFFEYAGGGNIDRMSIDGRKVERWSSKGERWRVLLLSILGHFSPGLVPEEWRELPLETIKDKIGPAYRGRRNWR